MWEARLVTETWGFWEFASVQGLPGHRGDAGHDRLAAGDDGTLPPHMVKNGSGLVNLARNVGGASALPY